MHKYRNKLSYLSLGRLLLFMCNWGSIHGHFQELKENSKKIKKTKIKALRKLHQYCLMSGPAGSVAITLKQIWSLMNRNNWTKH